MESHWERDWDAGGSLFGPKGYGSKNFDTVIRRLTTETYRHMTKKFSKFNYFENLFQFIYRKKTRICINRMTGQHTNWKPRDHAKKKPRGQVLKIPFSFPFIIPTGKIKLQNLKARA